MAEMTLEQVRDWVNNCAISNTLSSDISNEFLGELADAIDAAIKQRDQDTKDAERYRWLCDSGECTLVVCYEYDVADDARPIYDLDKEIDEAMAKESRK